MGFVLLTLIYLLPAALLIYSVGYLRDRAPKGLSAKDAKQLKALKIYLVVDAIIYAIIAAWILYDIFKAPYRNEELPTKSVDNLPDFRAAAAAMLTGFLTCFAFPLWFAGRAVMNTLLRKAGK